MKRLALLALLSLAAAKAQPAPATASLPRYWITGPHLAMRDFHSPGGVTLQIYTEATPTEAQALALSRHLVEHYRDLPGVRGMDMPIRIALYDSMQSTALQARASYIAYPSPREPSFTYRHALPEDDPGAQPWHAGHGNR